MVQESTSRPVEGDTAWLSCHRKISGLDKSKAASHTSSSFSSTERQRSTRRAFGWVEEVAAWKRSMPKAHRVKEVMPRDTNCGDEDVGSQSLQECCHFVSSLTGVNELFEKFRDCDEDTFCCVFKTIIHHYNPPSIFNDAANQIIAFTALFFHFACTMHIAV